MEEPAPTAAPFAPTAERAAERVGPAVCLGAAETPRIRLRRDWRGDHSACAGARGRKLGSEENNTSPPPPGSDA